MIVISKIYINRSFPLTFYVAVKRFMITKNFNVEIQNLIVNHESQSAKSNPALMTHRTAGEGRGASSFFFILSAYSRTSTRPSAILYLRLLPSIFSYGGCNLV